MLVTVPVTVAAPPGGAGLGITVWVMVEVGAVTDRLTGVEVAPAMELPGAGLKVAVTA